MTRKLEYMGSNLHSVTILPENFLSFYVRPLALLTASGCRPLAGTQTNYICGLVVFLNKIIEISSVHAYTCLQPIRLQHLLQPIFLSIRFLSANMDHIQLTSTISLNGFLSQVSGLAGTTSRWDPINAIVPVASCLYCTLAYCLNCTQGGLPVAPSGVYSIMRFPLPSINTT